MAKKFEFGDVVVLPDNRVGYVTAIKIDSVNGLNYPNLDEVAVKLLDDGSVDTHSSATLCYYYYSCEFKPGEVVFYTLNKSWGVIVHEDVIGEVCYIDFDNGVKQFCVASSNLVHRGVTNTKAMTKSQPVGKKSCEKCGGTGKVVLFNLPVDCECRQ